VLTKHKSLSTICTTVFKHISRLYFYLEVFIRSKRASLPLCRKYRSVGGVITLHAARHQVDIINLTLVIYGLQMHKWNITRVENTTTDLGFICVLLVHLCPALHACHLLIMSVMH